MCRSFLTATKINSTAADPSHLWIFVIINEQNDRGSRLAECKSSIPRDRHSAGFILEMAVPKKGSTGHFDHFSIGDEDEKEVPAIRVRGY